MDREILKGSVDILFLVLLTKKDMYGYEMAHLLDLNSNSLYRMSEGTLYGALRRLETRGLISSYVPDSKGSIKRYYHITSNGRKELEHKLTNWELLCDLIRKSHEWSKSVER
ncbi:PadR family transcriptional regulator [Metabacillus endolithicus]|uniref:PadR family transcriptional regulator n=1 Tax=Metabacillus endolithicus TaxID=1535204 RepID=A0ABW5C3G1_9BACI|nr:PadR family transcriptional regulator [Metabacillus endolithicus]UPG66026.1 PadR family transcriptional regulator [Metabacillus endolithicus]